MKKQTFNYFELGLYYIVIFFILREWLVPIMALTGTGHMELILLFIAISLGLSLFRIHYAISWIVKISYIAWFIVYVYTGLSVLSSEGLQFLLGEFRNNLVFLFRADWLNVTDPFRSILFFILIWMLIYLIHHWITVRITIFYFLILTVFFIGTLDTFTEYDGSFAIVKVVFLGLIMTTFLFLKRLQNNSGVAIEGYKYIKLVIPVLLLVAIVGITAVLLPKHDPQWPDPVPFIMSATGQGESVDFQNGVKKVGYGENDSKLGGSFVADDTVVFLAQADKKQYWRVETKDVYTSKGWEKSNYAINSEMIIQPEETIHHSLPVGPVEKMKEARIQSVFPYDFIIQPYGLNSIVPDEGGFENLEFRMNGNTEKLVPYVNNDKVYIDRYSVQYSSPTYLYSDLSNSIGEIDPTIKERYLQLPKTLPTRVTSLAKEIVTDEETMYGKARAIETYFGRSGFRYQTDDVPVPSEDQDYVDQFLFESKIGYCDNFSTSMVVMLRSVGIPARWVKGFAGGDQIDSNGTMKTFEVTNNDAHSWVEAYIPNVGWVNFEPTIGFSNQRSIDYNMQTDAYQEERLTIDEDTKPDNEIDKKQNEAGLIQGESNLLKNIADLLKQNKLIFISCLIILLLILVIIYKLRKKWMPKVYLKMTQNRQLEEATFEKMYMRLLKMLELRGLKLKEGQTLQSLAKEVDAIFGSDDMTKLTNAYERYIYGNNLLTTDFGKLKESWEYLINRCGS